MPAQNLGTLTDYILNGDNYTQITPSGQTLVIPGRPNPSISPLLAPNSDCVPPTDCYYPIIPSCNPPPGFVGDCALIVHDRITGWYNLAGLTDFNPPDDCYCALANIPGGTDAQCIAAIQASVDALDGLQIWSVQAPWMLAEMGLPRSTPFFADFWFIACIAQAVIIPNLINPPPPSVCGCTSYSFWGKGCCV